MLIIDIPKLLIGSQAINLSQFSLSYVLLLVRHESVTQKGPKRVFGLLRNVYSLRYRRRPTHLLGKGSLHGMGRDPIKYTKQKRNPLTQVSYIPRSPLARTMQSAHAFLSEST